VASKVKAIEHTMGGGAGPVGCGGARKLSFHPRCATITIIITSANK
jgi:hypothetical protein